LPGCALAQAIGPRSVLIDERALTTNTADSCVNCVSDVMLTSGSNDSLLASGSNGSLLATAWLPQVPEISGKVQPSGAAFSAVSVPRLPLAPARLSTITTVLGRVSGRWSPSYRGRLSLLPPVENGTMM
jgi:hypothetical protein